ncbi:MAG: hypothetical protein LBN00_01840 [Oscillospiraceae bacterium]|jgi:hypothetical protein|nr:hypothetical protein [Oscillospiraceae bacterium]
MEKFNVTRNDLVYGVAAVTRNGLMTEIDFSGTAPDEKIYRLAAVCNGGYVTLGVAAPDDNGKLSFRKSYSKNALRDLGFADPDGFALVLPGESVSAPEPAAPVFAPAPTPAPTTAAAAPEPPAPLSEGGVAQRQGELSPLFAPLADASSLFAEPSGYCDGELTGALARREGGITYLAVPLDAGEPFPLIPVFCFGEPERIDGRDFLVFKLNNGILTA